MGSSNMIQVINLLFIFIFFLLLSNSLHVEGSRFLQDHQGVSSSSFSSISYIKRFSISIAYSGPSRRGAGH
ncbi:hypothetical protein ERO13_D02G206860v2 [Gossypium hirsutum]|uniref:Transmembrane protein n=3 Tax=Gossypium TaxID=3633 RepID=A0A5D2W0A8_GOSMU|nr:hypothetical protein ERO13_D02G206860v2 [Gossypium hirsutum]TYG80929.1 hypothetical protein ES288_D02G256500v1 [Gossypium darwinii]TYH85348.1 hypothetical protein ES332_D02G259900v1 [Gossypium tomentosum]TYI94979.1 hypothetical protein E1A91_D02G245000v1 [Gossypium mustelinum]